MNGPTNYWIGVVSQEHVQHGVAGGFAQVCHGKAAPLARMHAGDWFVYYSPRTAYPGGEPCQAFTALGQIVDEYPYQVTIDEGFAPFRRAVRYVPCASVAIRELLGDLTFIADKRHWGAALRFGHLRIPAEDFRRIAEAMGAVVTEERADDVLV